MVKTNQHSYVAGVLDYYRQNDIQEGDPNEGRWDKAHYPTPKWDGGTETIWLLHEHHQVQGLLQTLEYPEKLCYFRGHVTPYLRRGFCPMWFDLMDIYEIPVGPVTRIYDHKEQEWIEGRRIFDLSQSTGVGRNSMSLLVRGQTPLLRGRYTMCPAIRPENLKYEKNEEGKTAWAAVGGRGSAKKLGKAVELTHIETGDVYLYPTMSEAARQLSLNPGHLAEVARKKRNYTQGFTALYIPGPNPFY